jgi:hypothetical protein
VSDDYLPDADGPGEAPEEVRAPFSFKLMIALTIAYLGWRLVQGIIWVVERLS